MDKYSFAVKIVQYWYLMEFLGQDSFPVADSNAKTAMGEAAEQKAGKKKSFMVYNTFGVKADSLPIAFKKDAAKYSGHSFVSDEVAVCIGKVACADCTEYLRQRFKVGSEPIEKDYRKVSLIGLKCDSQGSYIERSLSVSPLVWGISRLQNCNGEMTAEKLSEQLSLTQYNDEMAPLEKMLQQQGEDGGESEQVLTTEVLAQLIEKVVQTYWQPLFGDQVPIENEGVFIYKRYPTEEKKASDDFTPYQSDLSKSFFTGDLKMIEEKIKSASFGKDNAMQNAVIDYIVAPYAEANPKTGWVDFSKRKDIRNLENQEAFFDKYMDVSLAPLGKWPSKYMPAFMQQLAVNWGMHPELTGSSIFSVNGPPGTGKTTLLKEIIAGNVVERAKLLANYIDPDDAFIEQQFSGGNTVNGGYHKDFPAYYKFKNDKIKNHGMLVASCNNGAVENITKELPEAQELYKGLASSTKDLPEISAGLKEIKSLFDFRKKAEQEVQEKVSSEASNDDTAVSDIFFTKYANSLFLPFGDDKDWNKWRYWGLISAPFGRAGKIKWYADNVLSPYKYEVARRDKIDLEKKNYPGVVAAFNQQLEKVEHLQKELEQVSGAKVRFKQTVNILDAQCQEKLDEIELQKQQLINVKKQINRLEHQFARVREKLKGKQYEVDSSAQQEQSQQAHLQMLKNEAEKIRMEIVELEQKQGVKDWLFRLFGKTTVLEQVLKERRAVWEKQNGAVVLQEGQYANAVQNHHMQQQALASLHQQIIQLQKQQQNYEAQQQNIVFANKSAQEQVVQIRNHIEKAGAEYSSIMNCAKNAQNVLHQMTILDEEFWKLYNSPLEVESTMAQVENPWFTVKYNREREKLFYLALQVHKGFVSASKCCEANIRNLRLLWKMDKNHDKKLAKFSETDQRNSFGDLFNTVFLLTPVLSTTFASAGTMLANIKHPGELGLLIIDEAGQATPQMALGALYRCRRAIVVGDPKQVEPVVTSEMDAIKTIIRNDENILYQPKSHSVQEFADKINPIGTYFADVEKGMDTWVGCPLAVHRRCISPMYEISNSISYDNTMKQQTQKPSPAAEAGFCMESSQWINISGTANNSKAKDHYVRAQGEKALELVRVAFTKTEKTPGLYVISPFTSVKNGFKNALKSLPEYSKDTRFKEWANTHIGTVHTFQGKQTDEVIFLLGCDKNAPAAVRWVNSNIVNVAVTRAKYRIYFVGDYTVWKYSRVMQQVKSIMDSYAIKALKEIIENPTDNINEEQIKTYLKQMPHAEAFQADGEIADDMISSFQNSLSTVWSKGLEVSDAELERFRITKAMLAECAQEVRENILWGIKLYHFFEPMQKQFQVQEMDFSCAGIVFCKAMELHLKKCLLAGFKKEFPSFKLKSGLLSNLKEERAMIGTFTTILKDEKTRETLAEKRCEYNSLVCDINWWSKYYDELDEVRGLRNKCCHPEKFQWNDVRLLLNALFGKQQFPKTLVGKSL